MRVHFEYGRTGLDAEIPAGLRVRTLAYKQSAPLPDPAASLRAALERPTGGRPLAELAFGRKNVCIVICDITPRCLMSSSCGLCYRHSNRRVYHAKRS